MIYCEVVTNLSWYADKKPHIPGLGNGTVRGKVLPVVGCTSKKGASIVMFTLMIETNVPSVNNFLLIFYYLDC